MDTVTFADGSAYNCTFLATTPSERRAHIALSGVSFAEAAAIFSDGEKTCSIEWGNTLLVGYTQLTDLCQQPYGILATLLGGHDEPRQ